MHDSIVFIIAMFNGFITLLQHVTGQSALCCQTNVCRYVCMYLIVAFCMPVNALVNVGMIWLCDFIES